MAQFKPTVAQLQQGIRIPIGAATVQIPPKVFRARLTGFHFETDKTFLLPSAMNGIRRLKNFYDEHPGFKVLVSGHTDTVGAAGHNVKLSVERAESIAAFLSDDADGWMAWYAGKPNSQPWGVREDQLMLSALTDGTDTFYQAGIDGEAGPQTKEAVKRFQQFSNSSRGTSLAVDGIANPDTRRALVKEYQAQDGTTLPAGTEVDTHGCGFFHPAVKTPPGTDSLENRRVEIYIFQGAVQPAPQDPCPGPDGCPEYEQWKSQSLETLDLDESPATLRLWLLDPQGRRMPAGTPYRVALSGEERTGTLKEPGLLVEEEVHLREVRLVEWGKDFPREDAAAAHPRDAVLQKKVTLGDAAHPFLDGTRPNGLPDGNFLFSSRPDLTTNHSKVDDSSQVRRRLTNLGYSAEGTQKSNLEAFQIDYQVERDPDEKRKLELRNVHRDGIDKPDAFLVPGNQEKPEEDIPTIDVA